MKWQHDVDPRPALLVLPPAAASLDEAHGAIELWEHYSGKTLDPPQRLAVEVMMAETKAGRWAARTTGREMPRQNGKGDELEVVEFWGLTQRGEAILHTAHELFTVAGAHQRMVALLSHRDFTGKRKPKVLNGIGQQSIILGDAVIQYRTRTAGGGRGLDDISRLVVDEAQHARPEQLASATPTLLANPNPQMNFAGTGGIAGVSDWWWSLRIRALGSTPGDLGYVGHTAEKVYLDGDGQVVQEPVDPEDRSLWAIPNPALTYGRAEKEFFEEQLQLLGAALFAREHLGVWDPPPVSKNQDDHWKVIAADQWHGRLRGDASPTGTLGWAVDASPDGRSAAISCSDGRTIEVVDHRNDITWAPHRLLELRGRHHFDEVALDATGPAGALIPALEELGVPYRRVTLQEHAQACGGFLAAVTGDAPDLVHRGQPPLDEAVKHAERRHVTDVWLWTRSKSSGDICPLVSAGLARWWALQQTDGGDFLVV